MKANSVSTIERRLSAIEGTPLDRKDRAIATVMAGIQLGDLESAMEANDTQSISSTSVDPKRCRGRAPADRFKRRP
jgi:hypothetical protein